MSIDLHTHSTYSDGVLTPAALVRRAASRGVSLLALTDHDETGGIAEAAQAASEVNVLLVPGVEISVAWNGHTLHVLGLDIDPHAAELADGLASIRHSRGERAVRIAAQLDAVGVTGSLLGATRHAGNCAAIGRSHFARFLVEHKHVRNTSDAFRRYLGAGRSGYVPPCWPELAQAINWIHCAGGQAVLAHPDRYRLPPRTMQSLFEVFGQNCGDAIEISSDGRFKASAQIRLARQFGFALSSGSDFHAPGKNVADLGDVAEIPSGVPAVWQRLRAMR
ncbi:MAG TPA: PHP domain-containing protein [Acidiferrobacterales bacterium]|nr:PHP domain-containing protein [Acidiferrobacterales bacterium]